MINLSPETANRLRNAVFCTAGMRLSPFVDKAITEALDRLENKRGEPFPQRKAEYLASGRPVKLGM